MEQVGEKQTKWRRLTPPRRRQGTPTAPASLSSTSFFKSRMKAPKKCLKNMRKIIERYQKASGARLSDFDNQHLFCEMSRMKNENEKLQADIRHLMGEDLEFLPIAELHQLEQQLELSANRVRARKSQLWHQQVDNLRRKERQLEEQKSQLICRLVAEQAAVEGAAAECAMMDMGVLYGGESSRNAAPAPLHYNMINTNTNANTMQLQMQMQMQMQMQGAAAFRLQPTQPNLQDNPMQRPPLQLWYIAFLLAEDVK
ncbi:MADS-box protein GGM13 [Cryptomeria japonica]|uniref:MADS-box protein GGM13 n=1 Tax=Cryptomeria japonica TaxID=3369 RepID=UPI0025AC651F|nr:MADS-box protein GGM13 [Cryptomeria japonica]